MKSSGYGHQAPTTTRGPTHMSTLIWTSPDIRRTEQVYLAALVTSVVRSRLFVRRVCSSWQLRKERIDIAELLVSELASNAVQASSVTEPQPVKESMYAELKLIGVRLLELQDSLVIGVWDTSPQPPVLITPSEDLERGRGLQIVDALSIRWGYYDARMGGKAVWCQLARDDTDTDRTENPDTFQQIHEAAQAHAWNKQVLTTGK
jgi:anti-sigma regulatory factor (Ser/Thr protein kinase)